MVVSVKYDELHAPRNTIDQLLTAFPPPDDLNVEEGRILSEKHYYAIQAVIASSQRCSGGARVGSSVAAIEAGQGGILISIQQYRLPMDQHGHPRCHKVVRRRRARSRCCSPVPLAGATGKGASGAADCGGGPGLGADTGRCIGAVGKMPGGNSGGGHVHGRYRGIRSCSRPCCTR